MPACAVCGYQAAEAFKFCPECGVAASARTSEQRKVVTVLFCDVVGSTALGESTDPEAVRTLLARYFERMRAIVERHGGTVEKFIGDAVMTVFGIPVAHEDDALRACRAALEMRKALPELGLQGRIGVTTGEVVTGTEERLATGDAVNVAARLQDAAEPGEVLVGDATLVLVREAVEVEALAPLELKGKTQPVGAYRLLAAHEVPRRHEIRFVGRAQELAVIQGAWERVLAEQSCDLITIVGEAGVGKSRLVAESLALIGERVVSGRCLPYGDGITYWPVLETIKQLDVLPSDPAASAAIRSLLGESEAGTSADEIAWAFRKLLEEQSPLVVVFDDLQWGEETFLDLVEHVVLLSAGSPLLLLCMARLELNERRPTWPVAIRLEPLSEAHVDDLLPVTFRPGQREQLIRTCGGNPLFVTEMLAMAGDASDEVRIPPTLRALVAARVDQLEPDERRLLERGAVEGEIFHRGAVQALAPEDAQVTPRLASLVRKKLIRPDKAQLPGEDGFRFCHLLIRDVVYEGLPKTARAELHERFAAWLEERERDVVERDEILGYHLEQAARHKHEIGQPDRALAEDAGERLAAAGRRALWRGDSRAAALLLERALELTRPLQLDIHLEVDLASGYQNFAPEQALAIAEAAADRAGKSGDEAGEALACVEAARYRLRLAANPDIDGLETLAHRAFALLEEAGDHAGLAHVWPALGWVANYRGHYQEWRRAAEQELRHARLAGQERRHLSNLDTALMLGPTPADEALAVLDAALPENADPASLLSRAELLAMLNRFDEAWPLAHKASSRARELSGTSMGDVAIATVATLAGDHRAAASHLRRFCDYCEEHGLRGQLSTQAATLGRSLCALGRHEEAERLAELGRELGDEQDLVTQTLWRQVKARAHASRGEHAEAERLAREAITFSERTDGLSLQGDALCDLAEVLEAAGRTQEAMAAREQALEHYERKRNLAMADRVRAELAERGPSRAPVERA